MKSTAWILPVALSALLATPAPAPAQDADAEVEVEIDVDRQPVKVGEAVPNFTLYDVRGVLEPDEHELADYLAENQFVVLEFFNPDALTKGEDQAPTTALRDVYERFDEYDDMKWFTLIRTGLPQPADPGEADDTEDLGEQIDEARQEISQRLEEIADTADIENEALMDPEGRVASLFGIDADEYAVAIVGKDGILAYLGEAAPADPGEENFVAQAIEALLAGEQVPHPQGAESLPAGAKKKGANR